jgi:hypothetical protein
MSVVVKTDCNLAGQTETRQTTTSLMVWVSGTLVHWRAHTSTERIIIPSTAAGEYVALNKENTTAKIVRNVLKIHGSKHDNYFLEHIAAQPTMNEHSRSIDTRHHAIRQDYVDAEMRIGGVVNPNNESNILTKYLQPPLHQKHAIYLHILPVTTTTITNCATKFTSKFGLRRDDKYTPRYRRFPQHQQLPLGPSLQPDDPPILPTHPHDHHQHINRQFPATQRNKLPKYRVDLLHRFAKKQHLELQHGILQEIFHQKDLLTGSHKNTHGRSTQTTQQNEINPDTHVMPPEFLDLIFPQHLLYNGHRSLPPRRCDNSTPSPKHQHAKNTAGGARNPNKSSLSPDKRYTTQQAQPTYLSTPPTCHPPPYIQTTIQDSLHHP